MLWGLLEKFFYYFIASFSSANDMMRKTPEFWTNYVQPRLDCDFGGLHRFLNDPYPSGPNHYFERIEANIERLRRRLDVEKA